MDLRKTIQSIVERAVDGSVNYSGKERELNTHNWIQIATDKIIASVVASLPEPVDLHLKYEVDDKGILIDVNRDARGNKDQLNYLANFAEDKGYNLYYLQYYHYLQSLYNPPQPVVSSENEQTIISKSRFGQEDSQGPDNKEPSKVR